jgi:hypothetical protein
LRDGVVVFLRDGVPEQNVGRAGADDALDAVMKNIGVGRIGNGVPCCLWGMKRLFS